MMYKLIFSPQFTRDINDAFEYISNTLSSPNAAKKLMSEIDRSISNTASEPYLYPLCPEPLNMLGLRKIAVKNYIAVYTVDETKKEAQFLRLFYGRRNYTDFFN